MNKATTNWPRYQKRVREVIEYIHQNPGENLSSDVLAEVAHLSPFHWHRIYKAITGESAAATVKRCRMHNAAATLLRTDMPLVQVGESVGYPDIHSFNRTFKQFHGIAPGQFRAAQREPEKNIVEAKTVKTDKQQSVKLVERSACKLVGCWHHGDFMTIGVTFETVMAQCVMAGILPQEPQSMGLYLADPECTDEPDLKSFAGVVLNESVALKGGVAVPDGLEVYDYPGGRFAVLTHHGPYALLSSGYDWLYNSWLPASDEAVRDQPCSEVYLNSPIDTPQQELLTEICVPIE